MRACKKCGSDDIYTEYIKRGSLIKGSSDRPFLVSRGGEPYFHVTADIEHLSLRCRCCGFDWRKKTLDDPEVIAERVKELASGALQDKY